MYTYTVNDYYRFCVCVVRMLEINCLRRFQVCNTALITKVTIMYIGSLELIHK